MFRNLSNLISEVRARGKINTSVLSDSRITYFLNEACDDVANEFDFSHLYSEETILTSENKRLISGEFSYNRIELVSDVTANYPLALKNEDWIREEDPNMSQEGAPTVYSVWGYGYVRRQPTTSTVVRIVSDNAADTGIAITVRGRRNSDGMDITETITTNGIDGTTAVLGTTTFNELYSVSKSDNTTGTITATQNPVTTIVFAQLGPLVESDERQFLYLWPTPTDERFIHVRGFRKPRRMTSSGHFPDFPSNYHELVLIGGLIRAHRDLLRFSVADKVLASEFIPKLEQLKKEEGNIHSNRAPIKGEPLAGLEPLGRYPSQFPWSSNHRY